MWVGINPLDGEAEEAKIEIIHSAVVVFGTSWMKMEVTEDRFVVITSQEPYDVVIRDLVLGAFDLLRYTLVTQIGINRNMQVIWLYIAVLSVSPLIFLYLSASRK